MSKKKIIKKILITIGIIFILTTIPSVFYNIKQAISLNIFKTIYNLYLSLIIEVNILIGVLAITIGILIVDKEPSTIESVNKEKNKNKILEKLAKIILVLIIYVSFYNNLFGEPLKLDGSTFQNIPLVTLLSMLLAQWPIFIYCIALKYTAKDNIKELEKLEQEITEKINMNK